MITGSVAKKRSRPSSVLKNEAGAALVEAALIMIPFLLLLFGVIEFGLLLYDQQVLNNAAREGARAGIVVRTPRLSDDLISRPKSLSTLRKIWLLSVKINLTTADIVITKKSNWDRQTPRHVGKVRRHTDCFSELQIQIFIPFKCWNS